MKTTLILVLSMLAISCASAVPTGADDLCERYCQAQSDCGIYEPDEGCQTWCSWYWLEFAGQDEDCTEAVTGWQECALDGFESSCSADRCGDEAVELVTSCRPWYWVSN